MKYHYGDLFQYIEQNDGPFIVPHIVNNIGAWGSGFVVPLGKKFPEAKKDYKEWVQWSLKCCIGPMLGRSLLVKVGNVYVWNMCAQDGIMSHSTGDRSKVNHKPIRYASLVKCMEGLNSASVDIGAQIVCPKFGSDRAGGNWGFIEELIEEIWEPFWDVTVCTLEK